MIGNTTEAFGGCNADADRAQRELLDVRAVASLCGCSTRTVIRLSDAGRMPRPRKLGALTRWSRSELLDWVAAGCPSVQKGGAER
jgi:predicted DNA-binding transcriptional regulator AlpA